MAKTGCAKCGGAMKKMANGGSMLTGMPKYGNNPRTQEGRMLKKGGSTTGSVQHGCPPGKVRLANGKCGERPRFGG
jgi:hypothetical protein